MAAFDFGQIATSANPVLLFTVPDPSDKPTAFVVPSGSPAVYIGNSPNVSTTTGFLVPPGFPVQFDTKPNRGTQVWAVSSSASVIHWLFGA